MADCQNCPYLGRIETLERESEKNRKDHGRFFDGFEAQRVAQAVTDERYKTIINTLSQVSSKMEMLSEGKRQKWDNLVKAITEGLVSLLLGFLLGSLSQGKIPFGG